MDKLFVYTNEGYCEFMLVKAENKQEADEKARQHLRTIFDEDTFDTKDDYLQDYGCKGEVTFKKGVYHQNWG